MAEKQPYDVHWSKWPDYLTPDLERHFKRTGEKLVFRDVAERRYEDPEKYFAAIYWLGQQGFDENAERQARYLETAE